jgi:NADP-dependent 3-hydroxy acid dehydrogenase YdfG
LGDLDPALMNEVINELMSKVDTKEDRILVVRLDITDETRIQQAIQTAIDKWKIVDVLLNV